MIVVYTPDGGQPEHYDARKLLRSEASLAQSVTGKTWAKIKAGLPDDDLDSMCAVVFAYKKRQDPSLRWSGFDPGVEELVTRFDNREAKDYVTNALALRAADPEVALEQIAHALRDLPDACIDPEYARQLIAEMTTEDPKDPESEQAPEPRVEILSAGPLVEISPNPSPTSTSPGSSTSGSSPTSSTSHPQP
ncbi:hypothetical protein ACFXKG_18555 [Streptomyces sp. NPDC059255]|uniref:hypothetical protein n=1 Tax=Streptomyces sp. NPDC059255 TaxID=3346793 RepID=UPI00369B3177